ncbi:hypothetical protein D3C78_1415320 [compost metagenome]
MLVDEHHFAAVDRLAQAGVGLERHAAGEQTGFGHQLVHVVAQAGAGDQGDLQLFVAGALGQGDRQGLGFAGAGEAAHADGHAVLDQLGSFGCSGDLVGQGLQTNTIGVLRHGAVPLIRPGTNTVLRV